jgi:hypothetical protein
VTVKPSEQQIVLTYKHMEAKETTKPALKSTIMPWKPRIDHNYEFVSISRKALACFGYTGMHLSTPHIECQCHP